jgi:hypothetical protein
MEKGEIMRNAALLTVILLLGATAPSAWAAKTYQVTGPLLEMRDDAVVVQKGKEKWEIARDKETKMKGDVKVGSKVTIMYTMKATAVEAKEEAKKKKK